jgi:hypothetical protein
MHEPPLPELLLEAPLLEPLVDPPDELPEEPLLVPLDELPE